MKGRTMPAQAPLRFLRSGVITGSGIGLAAAAHTAAGGHLPPVQVLFLLTALCMAPVTMLSNRRFGLPAILGILTAAQAALHAAFAAFSGPASSCSGSSVAAYGHHQAAAVPGCAAIPAAELTANALAGLPGPAMAGAHVLAVAFTALLLARGEAALWQLMAWLAPLATLLNPVMPRPVCRIPALSPEAVALPATAEGIPPSRGPPSYAQ
jgi:hypothetical protein